MKPKHISLEFSPCSVENTPIGFKVSSSSLGILKLSNIENCIGASMSIALLQPKTLFNNDNPDVDPNMLVFIRERANYLKWLAPRVSSLFTEKQKIDVKSDSNIRISWEDNQSDMIDVSADTVSDTSDNKDL